METGVGKRIKKRRLELGLTQEDLAYRMGYKSKAAICKVEGGEDNVTSDRITKFAAALECSPSYLMGWEDDSEESKRMRTLTDAYMKGDLLSKIGEYDYEDILQALDFLQRIKQAPPEVQGAIQILLKSGQSDS